MWGKMALYDILRNRNGNWYVPNSNWNGSSFNRNANWLDNTWNSNYRVVLLVTVSYFYLWVSGGLCMAA
jgi:hypothetical protein